MSTDNNYKPSYFALKPGKYLYLSASSTEDETYPYKLDSLINSALRISIIALD